VGDTQLRFVKYHGLGNDFVIINNLDNSISLSSDQISFICDRHFGIGADGLIFARPSESDIADFFMDYYNSDGTTAEMCGNGIRCYAKYLRDENLTKKETIDIETRAGILSIELVFSDSDATYKPDHGKSKTVIAAKVDMGKPILEPSRIPVEIDAAHGLPYGSDADSNTGIDRLVDGLFEVDGESFRATCVSMGNPHCVTFVDDTANTAVQTLGPKVETSYCFPQKTNVEFAHVISRNEIELRVWERGCGETLACGTGACATLVAAVLNDKADRHAVVRLPGGNLQIEWAADNHVIMEGPAVRVFAGSIDI
jgi:diaminopimelate epimerase